MNDFAHPFDPDCEVVFSQRAFQAAQGYRCGNRELFYFLLHLGEHYDVLPLAYHVVKKALHGVAHDSGLQPEQNPDTAGRERLALEPASYAVAETQPGFDARLWIRQFAPVLLTEPCWLQNITQAATGDTQIAADLLQVHIRLTQTPPNAGDRYRGLLLQTDIRLPALCSWEFAQDTEIAADVYELAVLQLALAQFPRVFLPEILGFTLAYCRMSAVPLQLFAGAGDITSAAQHFVALRQHIAEGRIPAVQKAIADYLRVFPARADSLQQRMQTGLRLYRQALERCWAALRQRQQAAESPYAALLNMLREKAPVAFGHHGRIQLQGKSLDAWFAASPFDGEGFMTALIQSPYVDLERPRNSALFKFFEYNGPMFAVFDEHEIRLFENWLLAESSANSSREVESAASENQAEKNRLISPHASPFPKRDSAFETTELSLPASSRYDEQRCYEKLGNRELYYYLLNAELYPEVLLAAKRKAQNVLRLAGLLDRLPFERYEHRRFEAYLKTLYDREIRKYRPLQGAPKFSAATYRWGIEQFAPAILTDGCWLQHAIRLNHYSNRDIGKILYRIFCDEVGYGELEHNHPLIYRQLLESLDIRLPPLHSKAFVEHPGFLGRAFDLPVYLMSIAAFPNAFLPELLGLNLAIELSGLGRLYMSLAESLEYWGIDAGIVKVHISADNFASGHAAMAKQAVQAHLDEISACCGEREMQRHWRRIHHGYRSLGTASLWFFAALVGNRLLNKVGLG
ncbi:MAG: iron-containing redox enzyme family protein [Gammaproteobacteria bacterium]